MEEEWQPDAIMDIKIGQVRKELAEYAEKNSEKIDANIPVFFGYVEGKLESSFPDLGDAAHDRIIDEITVKVLEQSKRSADVEFIEKLFKYAVRTRRKHTGRVVFDIIYGIKMMDSGRYSEAIEILKKYRTTDAIVCTAIAYCYYVLSSDSVTGDVSSSPRSAPSGMALNAREQMIELARLKPPVNRLKFPQVVQELRVNKIFWFMIRLGIEWFPDEPEFLKIGLEKAKKDGNREMRGELLKLASERYYNDMFFLRDLYHFKIESRDASGATAVVRQMMQQHPEELEPIYYGMQLSIISTQQSAYQKFRTTAVSKNMPSHILMLLDFAFIVIAGKESEAIACLDDIKKRLQVKHHYYTLIEYIVSDIYSDDEKKSKKAKKVFLDSVDQYCLKLLKIKEW
jgi:hypothetical protein